MTPWEVQDAVEIKVIEIDADSVLLSIRLGDGVPVFFRMTLEDVFHGSLQLERQRIWQKNRARS